MNDGPVSVLFADSAGSAQAMPSLEGQGGVSGGDGAYPGGDRNTGRHQGIRSRPFTPFR